VSRVPGAVTRHADRHKYGKDDALADLSKAQLALDTIQWKTVHPLVVDEYTEAADVVGVKSIPIRQLLDSELLQSAKAAYLEFSFAWAATADGVLRLRDVTAGINVVTISLTGGEASERMRTPDILAGLTAGNEVKFESEVTVAGAAGETYTVRFAQLVVIHGAR